jgi:peptidylprolyl isomerase
VRRARIAAAQQASRKRDSRRRRIFAIGAAVLVAAIVLGAFVASSGGSSKSNVNAGTVSGASLVPNDSGAPTTAAATSVAGQPCVAMNDDTLPAGAPFVPVHVGPPPTQLVSEELRGGTGPAVAPHDTVTVNYVGVSCTTGKIFDTSYGKQAAQFSLDDVIPGWQQGIPGMQVGGQRLLGIPPNLAYGDSPPPGISPGETLWFAVELVSIDGSGSTTTTAAP